MLAAIRNVADWNAYGLLPAAGPANERPATCFIFEVVRNGAFQRWSSPPSGFNCTGHFVRRP
ncbi:MAG: hypothetical protein JWN67_720 [Actinomycetia bacterium]|nr:hypothetical protein [Actinomycetes bacterium]